MLPDGKDFVIADAGDNRLRRVNTSSGKIETIAGTGATGEHDATDPLAATFSFPQAVSTLDGTTFFVADRTGPTVRRLDASGVTTVAGRAGVTGTATAPGDGGPATAATLDLPLEVVALSDGGVLISDAQHYRIRRVLPDGTITTVAGTGVAGYDGDGEVSTGRIGEPVGLLETATGSLVFTDWWNAGGPARMRVRQAALGLPVPSSGGSETGAGPTGTTADAPGHDAGDDHPSGPPATTPPASGHGQVTTTCRPPRSRRPASRSPSAAGRAPSASGSPARPATWR